LNVHSAAVHSTTIVPPPPPPPSPDTCVSGVLPACVSHDRGGVGKAVQIVQERPSVAGAGGAEEPVRAGHHLGCVRHALLLRWGSGWRVVREGCGVWCVEGCCAPRAAVLPLSLTPINPHPTNQPTPPLPSPTPPRSIIIKQTS